MRKKALSWLGVAALAIGVAIFVAPSAGHAVTITSVSVTVGGVTWCDTGQACTNSIWTLPGGNLAPGAALVFAQTSGFNFDSSERNSTGLGACNAANPCATSITINGSTFAFASSVGTPLNFGNGDDKSTTTNESANYVSAGGAAGFNAFMGYADNTHTNACADTAGSVSGNCQPDPFAAGTNAVGAGLPAGFTETNPNHCSAGANNCFDSGVLEIVGAPVVPEASTLLLLGTGLMGVAAWSRRRLLGKN